MEKKMISVHAVTVHMYTIIIAILVLLLIGVTAKYWHQNRSVYQYTRATVVDMMKDKPNGTVNDYATIISTSAGIYLKPTDLQAYVASLSTSLNRNIIILDTNNKILADTIPANRGSVYGYDMNHVIAKTMSDGLIRSFEERSADYPSGLWQTVAAMKDQKGNTIGAVLVSTSTIK